MRKPQIGERIVFTRCMGNDKGNCTKFKGKSCFGVVMEIVELDRNFTNRGEIFGVKPFNGELDEACYGITKADKYIFIGGEKEEIE